MDVRESPARRRPARGEPGGMGPAGFAALARRVAEAARSGGLVVPAFRSPPRLHGARRTIRRYADGTVMVSVAVRDRAAIAVLTDMVEGVLAANGMEGREARGWRAALLADAEAADVAPAPGRSAA